MKTILAIDTSCDETSVAVTRGTTIVSNVIASQAQLHKKYGGVFPTVAKQAHKENLPTTTQAALKKAGVDWDQIDAIAITQGPGLAPALEVGIRFTQALAEKHQKPLLPINHIEGHLLSVLAQPKTAERELNYQLPALGAIVSGGHTEFILVERIGQYQKLGKTIDDAAGEALDKVGRMLDLGYPAGPVLEEFAKKGDAKVFEFPLPMTTSQDYNLSFSGLKTFSRNLIKQLEETGPLKQQTIFDFAASFQYAVFRHICHKLAKVLADNTEIKEIWLGGGVAANTELRKQIRQTLKTFAHERQLDVPTLRVPYTKKLCGDNAAMIGIVANLTNKKPPRPEQIERKPRWSVVS